MLKQIYEEIKKYNTIVIARHIGVDPDALGSQFALKYALELNFRDKNVYVVGTKSSRYNYFPKLDKYEKTDNDDVLLIVVDTPDKKRVDIANIESFPHVCKIDHHPFIEKFGEYEYIDHTASSAAELVLRFLYENQISIDKTIAELIYYGVVSDTNRFLFNTTYETFDMVEKLIKTYDIDISTIYKNLYARPFSEVRFQGYISMNLKLTENGFAYVVIKNDTLVEYGVDASSAGNMINNFNNIDEVLVWATISEDVKNGVYKFNIRSRGPIVNSIAEKYSGGGHALASGAKVKTLEEVDMLVNDLDNICKLYKEKEGI